MSDILSEFEDALKHHDWYYDYSDDGGVWRRGMAENDRIRRMRAQLIEQGQQREVDRLWMQYCPWAQEAKS